MRKLLVLTFSVLFYVHATAQNNPVNNSKVVARFDEYVKAAAEKWKVPGLSIVVVKNKQVVFKKAYGLTDLRKQEPFKTSTLSICASTTKAMTAACMGMLVDEGKIKWTDKVADVYPALKLNDPYANSELTIKDLFTHNAGLGNADMLWVYDYSIDTIIRQMRYLKPQYSFRSGFVYQNLMYLVAGEVIRAVSGKPWETFIKERLFEPLGMTHTYPNYSASRQENNHITPHNMYEDSVVKPILLIDSKTVGAAGGVWSSADDINKWMLFMLDSAKVNGKRLLQPNTYAALFAPQVVVPANQFYPTMQLTRPHWTTYALGWFQQDYKGRMVNFHTGSLDGAVAITGLIPDEDFGIFIFANLDHTEIRHALMLKAMDLWVFNDDKTDWSKDFYKLYSERGAERNKQRKAAEEKRVLNTKPSLQLSQYAGMFSNQIFGKAEIVHSGDTLQLKLPNNNNVVLSHWNYDTFLGTFEYEWYGKSPLTFYLDNTGKVSEFNFEGVTYSKQ